MTLQNIQQIGVIGYGSWATALVSVIGQKGIAIDWLLKNKEDCEYIQERSANPRYLVATPLPVNNFYLTCDIHTLLERNQYILMATPSAYLAQIIAEVPKNNFGNKYIISSIKGLEPQSQLLISEYFKQEWAVPDSHFCVLSGPSHAEEVSQHKTTYLTAASDNQALSTAVMDMMRTDYIHTLYSDDVLGVEYAGILKNIYTLGVGIALGLGYMDNFISAFVGACFRDLDSYLHKASPNHAREVSHSVYLGDLLTTAYSPFSRNRKLGYLIGSGLTPDQAIAQMEMVAEGYNATRSMVDSRNLRSAIAQSIYKILFQNTPPAVAFQSIERIII